MYIVGISYFWLLIIENVFSQQSSDIDELLNWCMDSKHHKSEPGPEGSLYGQCIPWKDKSCCRSNTTESMHFDTLALYNFNYDHCSEKKPLSEACKRHFIQDHCFYECSPNVGPWIVKETRSWRKERYYKVPLCASDCDEWFDACKYEYTCTDNWSKNFDWVTVQNCDKGRSCKRNICPSGSNCQTFMEIYRNAENFCGKVWDDAWEYTASIEKPCMRIWFNGSMGNPNDKVALWKAKMISNASFNKGSVQLIVIFLLYLISYNR